MTLTQRRPPAASSKPSLVSPTISASAPASIRIGHVQLRDLVLCPAERGVLWYVGDKRIVEQDILSKRPARQHTLATLIFTPVTIAALRIRAASSSGKDIILLAAGGQDAELFLAAYEYTPRGTKSSPLGPESDDDDEDEKVQGTFISERTTMLWKHMSSLVGSINNNVFLYLPPPSFDRSGTSDVDMDSAFMDSDSECAEPLPVRPRMVVSNNDCTVKFFDVSLARKGIHSEPSKPPAQPLDSRYWRQDFGRNREGEGWTDRSGERILRYERVGCLRLPVPVNHTSISPDGSTVLACGDTSTIYLFRILPVRDGNALVFEPLANYTIPVPPSPPRPPPASMRPIRQVIDSSGNLRPGSIPNVADAPPSTYLPFAFVDGSWVLAGTHPYYAGIAGADAPPACFATAWSADGTRFAAAGQEGAVRVWDVRSQNPLEGASWETVPDTREGNDASSLIGMWYDHPGAAPPWGVRALKFARNVSGREVLVFTEHVSRVHVVDADTFSVHDVVRVPHVQNVEPAISQSLSPHAPQLAASSATALREQRDSADHLYHNYYVNPHRRRPSQSSGSGPSSWDQHHTQPARRTHRPPRFTNSNFLPPRSETTLLPPPRPSDSVSPNSVSHSRRLLDYDNDAPLSVSPEAYDDSDALRSQQLHYLQQRRRQRPSVSHEQRVRDLESTSTADGDVNAPASQSRHLQVRRMARHYQRFLDDTSTDTLPNPSPAQEEGMRARARAALNLLREAEEAGREAGGSNTNGGQSDVDSVLDRLPGRSSPETSNLSSRSILHALMMRSMRMSSDASGSTSTSNSLRAQDGSEAGVGVVPRDLHFQADLLGSTNFDAEGATTSTRPRVDTSLEAGPSFTPRGRATQFRFEADSANMDEDANTDCPPPEAEMLHSPPPPVSAGVFSQSSFASSSPVEGPSGDGGWTDAEIPGLLSATSSDEDVSGWTDSAGSRSARSGSSGPSSPSHSSAFTLDSDITDVSAASITLPTPPSSSEPNVSTPRLLPMQPRTASARQAQTSSTLTQPSTSTLSTTTFNSESASASESLPPCRELIESTDPLDIAGVCFDPTGAYMYVATTDGLTEWTVQGACRRWWNSSGYI